MLYAADMPHHDFDPPEELFDQIAAHLDPRDVAGVMGETAADLFDLD